MGKKNNSFRQISYRGHLLFWSILVLCYTFIQLFKDGNDQGFAIIFLQNFKRMPAMLLAAYGFNNLLVPLILRRKRYVIFTMLSVLLFYGASAFDRIINVYVYEPLFRQDVFEQESFAEIFGNLGYLFTGYLPPLLIAAIALSFTSIVVENTRYERHNLQLERDKNMAELNVLKAQIHPHFLFNTLNNLYTLTIQKSDKAPKMVESLATMLDYILYQCDSRLVPLSDEINLVKNYIALERLRYDDEITIDFKIDFKSSFDKTVQIAPLLLLSIIENAFKHGVSNQVDGLKINIRLTVNKGVVTFKVKNTKSRDPQNDERNYTKGIGVANVKQQLELLYRDASFQYEDAGDWYIVELNINTLSVYV